MASIVLRDGREADVARHRRPDANEVERARRSGASVLREQGWPVVLIARHYGVSRQTVYNWFQSTPPEAVAMARRLAR